MVRRSFRFGLRLGLLGGAGFAVMKVLQARRDEREQEAALRSAEPWPPITPAPRPTHQASSPPPATPASALQPEAAPRQEAATPPPVAVRPDSAEPPPKRAVAATKEAEATWVDPEGRVCPPSHPIKGKLKSHLFHAPGMFAYDRTIPDRCYASEEEAEADGLSRARR